MLSISVVITTFNDSEYLNKSIKSVLEQTILPTELIVVDDGSENNDAKCIVAKFSKHCDFPIRYYYKNNGGPSSARNYGVSNSTAEYIAFLDADDIWLPNNLAIKLSLMEKCKHINQFFGVYGSFVFSNTDLVQKFITLTDSIPTTNLADLVGKRNGIPGGLPSYLIKKKYFTEVGGFDEKLTINEDFDLILRLIRAGYTACGDSQPGFIRTMREESLTRNSNHMLTFARVNTFLIKAKENDYFSDSELRFRRSSVAFSTARKILSNNLFDIDGYKLFVSALLIRCHLI
ncbi:glycosyltransferase family 2 protein [Shewanella sp. 10N.286.54.B9]|uniref:glycosyltransferase family 2 protein n=1 Tax=Shewanella sp. 10N.286.54.B9 TaxID=3229719 RepID=UPI00354F4B26